MFSGPWKRQVRLCPSFAQPRLAPAGTGRQGPFSFPLLAALLLGWITLRTARQLPRLNAQKFRKPGVSRRPWRLLATMPCRPPAWRKVALGLPTPPRLSLALLESRRRRWRAPRSPWPRSPACPRALPSPASRAPFLPPVEQVKAGAVAGTGSGGVRGLGYGTGESGPGQGRGPGAATTHRKNSGEEGLSLVEPASLKPELASFSHLTL